MDDAVIRAFSSSLPALRSLTLLGPFLVRPPAWCALFAAHPKMEAFALTQSPRFDVACVESLVGACGALREVRLKEIGLMSDAFLEPLAQLKGLTSLDLSAPGDALALSEDGVVDLLASIGGTLEHLELSGHVGLGDGLLLSGLRAHCTSLSSLALRGLEELTDAGVSEFFSTWPLNPPLSSIDLARCALLSGASLTSLLAHSGKALTHLDINGWRTTPKDALSQIGGLAGGLRRLDVGWCREVDDWVVRSLVGPGGCGALEEVGLWGCQRLTGGCPRKVRCFAHSPVCGALIFCAQRGVNLMGVEIHNIR